MPKNKTHSGASKRLRISGSGKILRGQANRRHKAYEHKSAIRARRGLNEVEISPADKKKAKRLLGR